MKNINNKLMTLDDARVELEREGMSCNFVADQRLVGVSSKWRWELPAKMDLVIYVQNVPGVLTKERFLTDLHKLVPFWLEEDNVDGNDCLPIGFFHVRQIMLVYYAHSVEPVFGNEIRQFKWLGLVAAQDAQGESFYLAEPSSTFCHNVSYQERRYYSQKLTGASEEDLQPPHVPRWFIVSNILIWGLIIMGCMLIPWYFPMYFVGLFLQFSIASIIQMYRKRKFKHNINKYARVGVCDEDGNDSDNCDVHDV